MSSIQMITTDRRFWPLFWTQFFGALNDNIFKNALVMMVTFQSVTVWGMEKAQVVALSGGLFILPFFLFSPLAGQIADKMEKSHLIRITKYWEVMIMLVAATGFLIHHYELLLVVLFLAGVQAALFGPIKYSMLPDLVAGGDLIKANAYVEMGTFLAILLGTIGGGVLTKLPNSEILIAITLLFFSLIGVATAWFVRPVAVADAKLKIEYNPIPTFVRTLAILRESKAVFNSVLGISWFWFFGAAILSILPVYCHDFLNVNETVVTCFLAMFTIGIGTGSFLCEKLSFGRVELGLVPIGSIGMTVFLVDLVRTRPDWPLAATADFLTVVSSTAGLRLFADFFLMSMFGGFFILPLYTILQERSRPESRSRVIAGNNIMNAIYMVVASGLVMAFNAWGLSYPQMFLVLTLINLVASIYIYLVVPEFTLRFYAWVLARLIYRIRSHGDAHIPETGPAILICNHVSFVDWLIIAGTVRRPIRFVMYYKYFNLPLARLLFRQAKAIPIAGRSEDPALLEAAFERIAEELAAGELVCIFPEGQLTGDGRINEFRPGIDQILSRSPVPVVPMALEGLWGTLFSRGRRTWWPRHWLRRVALRIGPILPAEQASSERLAMVVTGLRGVP